MCSSEALRAMWMACNDEIKIEFKEKNFHTSPSEWSIIYTAIIGRGAEAELIIQIAEVRSTHKNLMPYEDKST